MSCRSNILLLLLIVTSLFEMGTSVQMTSTMPLGQVWDFNPVRHKGKCGIIWPTKSWMKIVGGTEALKGEFPWQVTLQPSSVEEHYCGGILINKKWILTAAHCFNEYKNVFAWRGVLGEHDLEIQEGPEKLVKFNTLVIHRKYNDFTNKNDIAMLRISTRHLDLNSKHVRPVCLPNQGQQFQGNCVVTGWGSDKEGSNATRYLHKVAIPIIPNTKCSVLLRQKITEEALCAGLEEGGKDSCQGDSGGPLVCQRGKVWTVAGIVSWGYGCARPKLPGVYTNVAYYRNWIKKVMKRRFNRAKGVNYV